MANSLMNVAVLLPLTMLLLVPATLVAGQQQSPTAVSTSLQLSKQMFCSPNGNLVVDGVTDIVGAANASVSLKCDNNIIASAVSNDKGLVNINANVNGDELLRPLSDGNCQLIVYLPVANCTALNYTGTLMATAQVQSIDVQYPQAVKIVASVGGFHATDI